MKSTNQVELPTDINNTIDIEASRIPTTSEQSQLTHKEETALPPIQLSDSGISQALQHYGTIINFVQQIFQQDVDFGVIPGTKKPTLYKSGAEKLVKLFGLHHRLELVSKIEDFTGKSYGLDFPLFTYHYKCQLLNKAGDIIAEGEATCSSTEWKYKKQGVQGIWNSQNTICKISQKRALIAAVLIGVGASEFFTQDLEDMAERVSSETEQKPQPKTEPDDTRNNLIAAIDNLKKELNWSKLVASKFAEKIVNKKSRSEMLDGELYKLYEAMQAEARKIKSKST